MVYILLTFVPFLNRGSEGKLNDCQIRFINEIFKIEKPGAHPLSLADGKFLSMDLSDGPRLHVLFRIAVLTGQGMTFEEVQN